MKDSPKTKTGNILNRIDSKICHRSSKSNNSSTKQRDTNLFISITDKNHVRYEKYEKMKSLDVQAKAKATKQYSCQHVISDRYNPDGKLLLESVCKNKEALELGSIDYSPMKTSQVNHSIEKGSNKVNSNGGSLHQLETRLIDDKKLIDSKVQEHVNNDKIDLSLWNNNNLQLNQDVMNTLLDLIQDESLIQIYNAMNLRGNRCLLEQEVEKLEKKVARSFFRHVKHSANTSGEVIKKIVKRQITSSGVQVRGGQSCVDRIVPSYVTDPDTYHESAHCLRFSDIWYTLYKLNSPVIEHSLEVNIFEKHYVDEHVGHWSQLSKGMPTK
ncbi:hypothetical protein M8J77_022763 [Diaphorina citri]|nr:hypothetical protein M8J77_022763 [Diaphorina citri]